MAYKPTWSERLEDAKAYTGPILAGVVLLSLGGWVVWHEVRPKVEARREVEAAAKDEPSRRAMQQKLSSAVDLAEKNVRQAMEAGESDASVKTLIERAMDTQRERMRLDATTDPEQSGRLARLQAMETGLHARLAAARSEALERQARELQTAGRRAEAMDLLREALRWQREANGKGTPPEFKNLPREQQLALAIEQADTEPGRAAVQSALATARADIVQEKWDNAIQALAEARAAQSELSKLHPATQPAYRAELDRIDAEIAGLNVSALAAKSDAREREGDAAAAGGRTQEAGLAYAVAAAAQREINEKFPTTARVSAERVVTLESKRQTVLATGAWERVASLDREAAALLRGRQYPEALKRIESASEILEKAVTDFPASKPAGADLPRRLAYLKAEIGGFEAMGPRIFAQLVPLPGSNKEAMLKTEVTEELFAHVMQTKAAASSATLSVDSVSWTDAAEFCRRLSWLLGAPVRLPTETEFLRIYRADKTAALPGFDPLALAEWLQPTEAGGETAPVAGRGSVRPGGSPAQLPVTAVKKSELSPFIGFRVVVETGSN